MARTTLMVLAVLLLPVWAIAIVYVLGIRSRSSTGTDWLKNVLASGAATIVHAGHTYPVDRPEIVPMESARAYFPAVLQRIDRLIGVDRCLRVRRASSIAQSE